MTSISDRINAVFLDIPSENTQGKLVNQAHYHIANQDLKKAQKILESLRFPSVKKYIQDEYKFQRQYPEKSGFLKWHNKPMPKELIIILKELN